MPAADRRAGFPTVCVLALSILFVVFSDAEGRAALSPPPVRLALLFGRSPWGPAASPSPLPVLPGSGPVPFEVP